MKDTLGVYGLEKTLRSLLHDVVEIYSMWESGGQGICM